MHSARLSLFATLLLAACSAPMRAGDAEAFDSSGRAMGPTNPMAAGATPADWAGPSPLYARDGSIVSGDREASVALATPGGEPAPTHDIQRTGEGRMYILELYQNVIVERDTLTLEIRSLGGELDRTRSTLVEADVRIANLESRVTALEAQKLSLETENMDLAGRLTTAQIRRLQAEKILLEIRLEESLALDAKVAAEALAEAEAETPAEDE